MMVEKVPSLSIEIITLWKKIVAFHQNYVEILYKIYIDMYSGRWQYFGYNEYRGERLIDALKRIDLK